MRAGRFPFLVGALLLCACHGDKKKEPAPSTTLAPVASTGPCAPDQVEAHGSCQAVVSFYWNGRGCDYASGCDCTGRDCKRWHSIKQCAAAHAACMDAGR